MAILKILRKKSYPQSSYGDFWRFPREIRDLIYAEYFSADQAPTIEKYLDNGKSRAILFVTDPDTNLLRASRALYVESQPFWEECCKGRRLIRVAADLSTRDAVKKSVFLTVSAESLPKPPPFTRLMHLTWVSYRWLQNPRLYRVPDGSLERARIVIPNLSYFLSTGNNDIDQTMDHFAYIIRACSWKTVGRLNVYIEDAKWPILEPGENVWYKRLHQGMTRRSLMKSRESKMDTIVKLLTGIIERFQKLVSIVTFTFGDIANGRYRDNTGEIRRIVDFLQKKVRCTKIGIEYV